MQTVQGEKNTPLSLRKSLVSVVPSERSTRVSPEPLSPRLPLTHGQWDSDRSVHWPWLSLRSGIPGRVALYRQFDAFLDGFTSLQGAWVTIFYKKNGSGYFQAHRGGCPLEMQTLPCAHLSSGIGFPACGAGSGCSPWDWTPGRRHTPGHLGRGCRRSTRGHCPLSPPAGRRRAPGHSLQAREQWASVLGRPAGGGYCCRVFRGEMPRRDSSRQGRHPGHLRHPVWKAQGKCWASASWGEGRPRGSTRL